MNSKKVTLDLKVISILLLTLYMLTSTLYVAVFNSLLLHLVVLLGILVILILSELTKDNIYYIKKIDLFFWLASLTIIIGVFTQNFTNIGELSRPLSLSIIIIISLLIRVDIQKYRVALLLIKWAAFFFSISVLISYFFPELYRSLFLYHLNYNYINAINQGMQEGYHTGFSAQVAYTAGYIIQGIGIIFCVWVLAGKNISKIDFLLITVMMLGLLFTQKRAHLLFLFLSVLIVYIQFSDLSIEKLKKSLKVFCISIILISFIILLMMMGLGESFFFRIIETYQNLLMGNDITSNRWPLWLHSIEIFKQYPWFGIGWGNFSDTVIGNVTIETEMETHNVYLQLLSEMGIIGSLVILIPIFVTYFYTLRVTRFISVNKQRYNQKWIFAVLYSLFSQTFFLLYGITGNPLYDYSYFTMYFIAVGIIYSFKNYEKLKGK